MANGKARVRHVLGLDIGSNSVGSAWVDLQGREVLLAASVFPAGVDEQEDKRGSPKNQARRRARSQRRTIHRRAMRKRKLIRYLMDMEQPLLPCGVDELRKLFELNPWQLRREGLERALAPFEFGRILVHLAQRRGAVGVVTDPDDDGEGKVKEGMDRLREELLTRYARSEEHDALRHNEASFAKWIQKEGVTVGRLLADLLDERRQKKDGVIWNEPIRNRQYRMPEDRLLFAGRELIRQEFHLICEKQRSFGDSALARMLTDDLIKQLDNPGQNDIWRHRGLLFGQRRTYWDTGTLGRCVLEPTERCVPIADRHASYFRVLETVNSIRIEEHGSPERPLKAAERRPVIDLLRGPLFKKIKGKIQPKSSASVTDIKQALGIAARDRLVKLNLEADEDREINTDWFYRAIVHGAFGPDRWDGFTEEQREAVNRAILRLDPDQADDAAKLREMACRWWGLDAAAVERLIEAWKGRPKLEKRLNLSRRAICNLLPFMEHFDERNNRWPTQQDARKAYAKTLPEGHARRRYETGAPGLTAADRRYMRLEKHQIADGVPELPPAPTLSNPVVRKTIHEVRRHLLAYLRKFGRKPDRVVIEMARITKQSERRRNEALARNRNRDKIRKGIIDEILPAAFGKQSARKLSLNQQRAAVDRVVLARQQTHVCPNCGNPGFTDKLAAKGNDVEIDHIVPYSRCGDDGLNNKVLVHRTCNRGKGNRTLHEWWGANFDLRVQFGAKLFKDADPGKGEYFTKRDYARKWENFNREVREGDEWRNSQLTDTAYAARQVAAYLADALFDGRGLPERGDGEGNQKIFFTMGRFTAMLRKDWQLFETLKPKGDDGMTAEEELQLAEKDRGDYRQHAIDAVTIALTQPNIKHTLASWAAQAAEYKERHGQWPKRTPIAAPWDNVRSFRHQVLTKVYAQLDDDRAPAERNVAGNERLLIVSHRPVKRRLVGAFHEETHYGPVIGPLPRHRTEKADTLFTNRIRADRLTPNHLRVPEGWDKLSAKLDDPALPAGERKSIRKQLSALPDPSPGKSGIVRDRELRDRIRKCLRSYLFVERDRNGKEKTCHYVDPDDFSSAQIKQMIDDGKLTMASGIPIKSVVLLRTNTDPVIIPRKRWDPVADRMVSDDDPRTKRVYIGGNNHHIEIRADHKGRWAGKVISTFDVARRLRPKKSEDGILPPCRSAVDRNDGLERQFVMSLAEGEMIHARRWDPSQKQAVGSPDYFVVCKLDKPARIHFAAHWDGRKARDQDRWDVTPADLKHCGPEPGKPPVKVRVGPLGDITPLPHD